MKTFDLQRAIAGDPLLTREGKPARFVAHVPECDRSYRVIAIVEGDGAITAYGEDGRRWHGEDRHYDLMMAPKKRTVWANLWPGACGTTFGVIANSAYWYRSVSAAEQAVRAAKAEGCENPLAIAVPIEIEE